MSVVKAGTEQGFVEVVVMADVAAAGREAVPGAEHRPQGVQPAVSRDVRLQVGSQDGQQIVQGAFGNVPLTIHVGLAEVELGIAQDAHEGRRPVQAPGSRRLALAEHALLTLVVDHRQPAPLNELFQ